MCYNKNTIIRHIKERELPFFVCIANKEIVFMSSNERYERMRYRIYGTGQAPAADAILLAQSGEIFIEKDLSKDLRVISKETKFGEKIKVAAEKTLQKAHFCEQKDTLKGMDFVLLPRFTNGLKSEADELRAARTAVQKGEGEVFVLRGAVPVGCTRRLREETGAKIFSVPDLACGDLQLALYPTHIIAGADQKNTELIAAARKFVEKLCPFVKDVPVRILGEDEAETAVAFSAEYFRMQDSFFKTMNDYAKKYGINAEILQDGVNEVVSDLNEEHSQKGKERNIQGKTSKTALN